MKRIKIFLYFLIIGSFVFSSFGERILANEVFIVSNETKYEVSENGKTRVTQNLTFHNQSSEYWTPGYQINLGKTLVENVSAQTDGGVPIVVGIIYENNQTQMTFDFGNVVVQPKENFSWEVSYNSPKVTEKRGQVYEINLPKFSNLDSFDRYDLELVISKRLGEINYVLPTPITQSEDENNYWFNFSKDQLQEYSVVGAFGPIQIFDFTLKYQVENSEASKAYTEIAFPSDKSNQQVFLEMILPKPQKTRLDKDGNILAYYELEANEELNITLSGYAKVWLLEYDMEETGKLSDIPNELDIYTQADKYWDYDSNEIKEILVEIKGDEEEVGKIARSIFDYVTETLIYNDNRLDEGLERLGAQGVLKMRDQAVCMEYADLYIALARAAGIPAREIDGFAYNAEKEIGYEDVLHAWVEIYVPPYGWIPIDPTWSSTAPTLDFFSKLDTNHLAFITRGESSEFPHPPGSYKNKEEKQGNIQVFFSEMEKTNIEGEVSLKFGGVQNLMGKYEAEDPISGVIPQKVKIIIDNKSLFTLYEGRLNLENDFLKMENLDSNEEIIIPPYGQKEIIYKITNPDFFSYEEEMVSIDFEAQDLKGLTFSFSQAIPLKMAPFLGTALPFLGGILGAILLLFGLIFLIEKSQGKKRKKR